MEAYNVPRKGDGRHIISRRGVYNNHIIRVKGRRWTTHRGARGRGDNVRRVILPVSLNLGTPRPLTIIIYTLKNVYYAK